MPFPEPPSPEPPSPESASPEPLPSGNVGLEFCATLIDQWVRLGVQHAVISPGSRSTPLALACAEHPFLRTHVHHDERSAAFMALGIGIATGLPAVMVTTSGTAAVELHPAIVEAHQAHVPMLAVTADRPPELQGVGAPQTIDQRQLFGGSVRWFVEPGPPDDQYRNSWRYLATDAFAATRGAMVGAPPGPVHLNLAFREPLIGTVIELPPTIEPTVPTPAIWGLIDEQVGQIGPALSYGRGLIVAGRRAARNDADRDAILALATLLGWPVLADHQSGVRVDHPQVVTAFDSITRVHPLADRLRPEFVVRVGGLLASRFTNEWLAHCGAKQIGIDRWGVFADPDHVLADRITGDIGEICRQLVAYGPKPADAEWTSLWHRTEAAARVAIVANLAGEPLVVNAALEAVPAGGSLMVSSSMPVRDLEWYGSPRGDITVVSNRGANGIDGVTSTAVGVALGSGRPTVCVIGDVAFLHDTNALLGLARRDAPLCIVVIDNDGGGIFSFLPQAEALANDRFEQLFGTPHGVNLAQLTASHGIEVHTAGDLDELDALLAEWAGHLRPLVIVVPSDRHINVDDHRLINEAVRSALENTDELQQPIDNSRRVTTDE